jgi:hypothetical protein
MKLILEGYYIALAFNKYARTKKKYYLINKFLKSFTRRIVFHNIDFRR